MSQRFNPFAENLEELYAWGSLACEVRLGDDEEAKISAAHSKLEEIVAKTQGTIYGIDTWYGVDCQVKSSRDDFVTNQLSLLNFLHVGVGEPISESVVRRALKLQLKKVALGHSGVTLATAKRLEALANSEKLPRVPRYGSLGASGDLIPMAHAIKPIFVGPNSDDVAIGRRDVLGLVNTNSMMSALGVEIWHRLDSLLGAGVRNVALVSIALAAPESLFNTTTTLLPDFKGLQYVCTQILKERNAFLDRKSVARDTIVQDKYSLRCAPQVMGALYDACHYAASLLLAEATAIADNPVIVGDELCHGGLFYTSRLSTATNIWSDCIGRLADLLDREMFLLVSPQESGLPVNLQISSYDHVKGIHQLISSLNQQIRASSVPSFLHAVPSEGYNQDVVPATMASLLSIDEKLSLLEKIIEATHFIAHRGALMRTGREIGEEYRLARWQRYPEQKSGIHEEGAV